MMFPDVFGCFHDVSIMFPDVYRCFHDVSMMMMMGRKRKENFMLIKFNWISSNMCE